jgi:hypothetical protein
MSKKFLGYHKINYGIVDKYIKGNPDCTYKQFMKDHPKVSICGSTFSQRKDKIFNNDGSGDLNGKRRKGPKVYTLVWSYTDSPFTKGKSCSVIKDFVISLNRAFNLKLEVVEMTNPQMLEVRRLTK